MYYEAIFDFEADANSVDELSLRKGDICTFPLDPAEQEEDNGWIKVECRKKSGFVPLNRLQLKRKGSPKKRETDTAHKKESSPKSRTTLPVMEGEGVVKTDLLDKSGTNDNSTMTANTLTNSTITKKITNSLAMSDNLDAIESPPFNSILNMNTADDNINDDELPTWADPDVDGINDDELPIWAAPSPTEGNNDTITVGSNAMSGNADANNDDDFLGNMVTLHDIATNKSLDGGDISMQSVQYNSFANDNNEEALRKVDSKMNSSMMSHMEMDALTSTVKMPVDSFVAMTSAASTTGKMNTFPGAGAGSIFDSNSVITTAALSSSNTNVVNNTEHRNVDNTAISSSMQSPSFMKPLILHAAEKDDFETVKTQLMDYFKMMETKLDQSKETCALFDKLQEASNSCLKSSNKLIRHCETTHDIINTERLKFDQLQRRIELGEMMQKSERFLNDN